MANGRLKFTSKSPGIEYVVEVDEAGNKIVLGSGGQSIVYKARKIDNGEDKGFAAIKYSNMIGEDWRVVDRFMRQRDFISILDHENIVHFFEFNENENSDGEYRPWLAMEFVEGKNLDELLETRTTEQGERGRMLPVNEVISITEQVIAGLEYTHSRPNPILHRDLHPKQVMIQPDGKVKLLDFGSGKEMIGSGEDMSTAGVHNDYATPEHYTGGPYSPATDVYQVGLMLYKMLMGHNMPREDRTGNRVEPFIPQGAKLGQFEDLIKRAVTPKQQDRITLREMGQKLQQIGRQYARPAQSAQPGRTGQNVHVFTEQEIAEALQYGEAQVRAARARLQAGGQDASLLISLLPDQEARSFTYEEVKQATREFLQIARARQIPGQENPAQSLDRPLTPEERRNPTPASLSCLGFNNPQELTQRITRYQQLSLETRLVPNIISEKWRTVLNTIPREHEFEQLNYERLKLGRKWEISSCLFTWLLWGATAFSSAYSVSNTGVFLTGVTAMAGLTTGIGYFVKKSRRNREIKKFNENYKSLMQQMSAESGHTSQISLIDDTSYGIPTEVCDTLDKVKQEYNQEFAKILVTNYAVKQIESGNFRTAVGTALYETSCFETVMYGLIENGAWKEVKDLALSEQYKKVFKGLKNIDKEYEVENFAAERMESAVMEKLRSASEQEIINFFGAYFALGSVGHLVELGRKIEYEAIHAEPRKAQLINIAVRQYKMNAFGFGDDILSIKQQIQNLYQAIERRGIPENTQPETQPLQIVEEEVAR